MISMHLAGRYALIEVLIMYIAGLTMGWGGGTGF